ncbi:FAD-dependent oxidoreductase [Lactococcus nasutitermitis]|uniref:FAD-dependent oxidoreductase n=1 Tax=Lactococcus nasutitermitis TaxID=1652957 RepID=A0ABV9JF18_9LACT|nr:FAD-dependent oxidoreductase [Lactococcus nasutitermitis]
MKVVIIGGSHAGIACARRTREEFPDAEVVIYEKQAEISFISQSIPLYLMGKNNLRKSSYVTAEVLRSEGIIVETQTVVKKIDSNEKTMTYQKETSDEPELTSYDKLVLAVGSYPLFPMFSGDFTNKLFVVKSMEDAKHMGSLPEKVKKLVVVGGGFIGVELSRIFVKKGLDVTLLQASEHLLDKYLDTPAAENIENVLRAEGVKLELSTFPVDIREENNSETGYKLVLYTYLSKKFEADAIIYAVGFRPNSFLLANQVTLGDMGAVEVDEYMRTSEPDIFAVGDCSTTYVNRIKHSLYLPHASDAIRQGEIAAINLVEARQKINSSQGTYNMNIENRTLCVTGLTQKRAQAEGFDCDMVYSHNSFLNSDEFTNAWLVYEKRTHKILGVQIEGTAPEVSGYVDTFSLAIEQNLSIEDIEFTDFYFKHGYQNPEGLTKILAQLVRKQNPKIEENS